MLKKWKPTDRTCPHWYPVERLRGLIAAYLQQEADGKVARTVRELVSEFAGLSGSAKQKLVTDAAGLTGATLSDLVENGDVSGEKVERLLKAMQAEARPVKPAALGAVGAAHLKAQLAREFQADPEETWYQKIEGVADGLPFVLEAAAGFRPEGSRREIRVGVNWTPAMRVPFPALPGLLSEARVDPWDPVAVVVHLACPRIDYTDRGKTAAALPPAIRDALAKAIAAVTKAWNGLKRDADRENRVRAAEIERWRKARQRRLPNVKEASRQVMAAAYLKASGEGAWPATASQMKYATRPGVLELTKGKIWKNSSYFTQELLPDFVAEHPELTRDWDIVYDDRGHFAEPHTDNQLGLGTVAVRKHIAAWDDTIAEGQGLEIERLCPTTGPKHRYRFALFVEKEGFDSLLERAKIAERYDLAIMSTKGMSVTAARLLVERLTEQGVTILVLHDFDAAGFSIFHTLGNDTRRYTFETPPNLIDLGLRLTDAKAMGLESEPVYYDQEKDPRERVCECGATEAECNFLVTGRQGSGWIGKRVELNAMTSPQILAHLEAKLGAVGLTKVVPNQAALTAAYRRAWHYWPVQQAMDAATAAMKDEVAIPEDLAAWVEREIRGTDRPWDDAVWERVQSDRQEAAPGPDRSLGEGD